MFQIISAPITDPGRKRRNNEDWTAQFEPPSYEERIQSGCLYIVADGVGGAAHGERASQYATQKVLYEYYHHLETAPAERMRQAMRKAGNEIYQYAEEQGEGRMATTMVAAVILGDKLIVANVGDSRAYLLRDGGVHQITRDHSLVGEMIRDGSMTEEESLHAKVKNSLTRSLGGERDTHVDLFELDLQTGDRLLLSTDGLLRYITRKEIAAMLSGGTPREAAERMVKYALEQGGADNITVLPIEIGPRLEEGSLGAPGSGQGPEPADWELMTTQAASPPPSEAASHKATPAAERRSRRKQYYILYGLFGGAALLTLGALFIFLIWKPAPETGQLAELTATGAELSLLMGTNDPAVVIISATSTDTPSPTQTITPSPDITATQTSTSTLKPSSTAPWACIERVDAGENLSIILDHYALDYECISGSECTKYFYFQSCKKSEEGEFECSDRQQIDYNYDESDYWNYPMIDIDWWIEIPVTDTIVCEGGGGKILYYIEDHTE